MTADVEKASHPIRHRRWPAWLVAAALLMKLLVPGGYMFGIRQGAITVELCSGHGPMRMTMPIPGLPRHDDRGDHGKADAPCAFAAFTQPALSGADPVLLAAAIGLIVATVFRMPARRRVDEAARLRPPSRGPPFPA